MENDFEQPDHAPTSARAESPVKMRLEYKPGKTPEQYAKHANAKEDEKVGFRYYDNDLKRSVKMDKITFFVIGMYSQIAGAVKITDKEYRNYQTNLCPDTRTDIFVLREAYVKDAPVLCKGDYHTVKAFVNDNPRQFQGVGYRQVMVAYVKELDKICSIEVPRRLEYAMRQAIAKRTGEKIGKVSLLGLTDISSEIWGFNFAGEYLAVNEKDEAHTGKGDLFFAPVLGCGIIKPTSKGYEQLFPYISSVQDQMRDYINAQQAYYGSADSDKQRHEKQESVSPVMDTGFPTAPPANDFEAPNTEMDALPF